MADKNIEQNYEAAKKARQARVDPSLAAPKQSRRPSLPITPKTITAISEVG